MKWTIRNRWIAVISGLLAGLALLAAYLLAPAGEGLLWQRVLIPIALGFTVFGITGSILHRFEQLRLLKALPGVDFPFAYLYFVIALGIYFLVVIVSGAFLLLLAPASSFSAAFFSWPHILIFMLALTLICGSGSYLLINQRNDGRIYRDCVSRALFSRQDYFFSLIGHWDDGIILGDKCLRYDGMNSVDIQEKSLTLRGYEEEVGQNYALILYTPRIIKKIISYLQDRNIPNY